jgi:hypothetical protein
MYQNFTTDTLFVKHHCSLNLDPTFIRNFQHKILQTNMWPIAASCKEYKKCCIRGLLRIENKNTLLYTMSSWISVHLLRPWIPEHCGILKKLCLKNID